MKASEKIEFVDKLVDHIEHGYQFGIEMSEDGTGSVTVHAFMDGFGLFDGTGKDALSAMRDLDVKLAMAQAVPD